jgi:glycosyltransferase involved in cell wall biosynthesis
MPVVYRLANLFILCSISETWGLSVNEAMACGIPVIASSTCACTLDLLSDGKGGLAFGYNNTEAPAAYITELCTNRERLLVLGQQATEKIKNFSFENIVKAIDELMKKI